MVKVLPSVSAWVDELSFALLSGERRSVVAPPTAGKSTAARSVLKTLGPSALYVTGRDFSDGNLLERITNIRESLTELVAVHGGAQLIFDDYDRALRRQRGSRLQANLYGLLVDSALSRDLGALFLSRCAGPQHVESAGSPLMSRVEWAPLPRLGSLDFATLGVPEGDVVEWFGDSAFHASRAVIGGSFRPSVLAANEKLQLARLLADMPSRAKQFMAGKQGELTALTSSEQSSLRGLFFEGRPTRLADGIGLVDEIAIRAEGWPRAERDRVSAFCDLIAGQDRVLWVDRYLYSDVPALRRFLEHVARVSSVKILLLGSPRRGDLDVDEGAVGSLSEISTVKAHFMNPRDWHPLHDRHLVRMDKSGGWVVPMAAVVLGRFDGGSAVVTNAHSFPFDYAAVLRRSAACG